MHMVVKSDGSRRSSGFTIVELLIVIVVIGILAALTIVAFNGVTGRANIATVQSDLANAVKALNVYKFNTSASEQYPPDLTTAALKASSGTTYNYAVNNNVSPSTFCLTAVNGTVTYRVSSGATGPVAGTCTGVLPDGTSCPSGFITVPGNTLFGTTDFCVMKYEAKQASSTVPISQATGTPWGSITQPNAITYSANVAGCTGCHLIGENEWLTIVQNVLAVATNWSSGTVGTGYIYSGHNDNSPGSSLAATIDDSDGYNGTGNSGTSSQRRTLTLSNGEVIWDFAGNVWEWTNSTIAGSQQPGLLAEGTYGWKEWNNGSLLFRSFPTNARPSYGTAAASGWTTSQGIGALYSYYSEASLRGFLRGGSWGNTTNTGVTTLYLGDAPTTTGASTGFRVAK